MAPLFNKRKVKISKDHKLHKLEHTSKKIEREFRKPSNNHVTIDTDSSPSKGLDTPQNNEIENLRSLGEGEKAQEVPERTNVNVNNINLTTKLDFEQNLCKPFAKTGHCKYGDECKFVHEREVKLPLNSQTLKSRSTDKESSRTGCGVCGADPIIDPVLPTNCEHKICEKCFISKSKENKLGGLLCTYCNSPIGMSIRYI